MKNLLFALLFVSVSATAQVTVQQTVPASTTTLSLSMLRAVALINSTDTASAWLQGSTVVDSRSVGQVTFKWSQVSGVSATIETPDSLGTRVFGLPVGTYKFRFIVTDNRINVSDTSFNTITVGH